MTEPGAEPAGGRVVSVDYDALDGVAAQFDELGVAFDNVNTRLGHSYDNVTGGAGQFAPLLEGGATRFLLAWFEALHVCEQASLLISRNVGKTVLNFETVDVELSNITL